MKWLVENHFTSLVYVSKCTHHQLLELVLAHVQVTLVLFWEQVYLRELGIDVDQSAHSCSLLLAERSPLVANAAQDRQLLLRADRQHRPLGDLLAHLHRQVVQRTLGREGRVRGLQQIESRPATLHFRYHFLQSISF